MATPNHTGELWTRVAGESAKAYAAFILYRDLGAARSIQKAYARHQAGTGSVPNQGSGAWRRWCSKFNWITRCAAWDDHLAREASLEQIKAVKALQSKHQVQLQHLQNQLIKRAQAVDFSTLTAEQVIRFTLQLINAERLIHGEPVTMHQHQHTGGAEGARPIETQVQVAVKSVFEPAPEFVADVMRILEQRGGLSEPASDDEPEPEVDEQPLAVVETAS